MRSSPESIASKLMVVRTTNPYTKDNSKKTYKLEKNETEDVQEPEELFHSTAVQTFEPYGM